MVRQREVEINEYSAKYFSISLFLYFSIACFSPPALTKNETALPMLLGWHSLNRKCTRFPVQEHPNSSRFLGCCCIPYDTVS